MTAKTIAALLAALSLPAQGQDITIAGERGYSAILHVQTADVSFSGKHPVASATVSYITPAGIIRGRQFATCEPCSAGWLCGGYRWIITEDDSRAKRSLWVTNGPQIGDSVAYDICFVAVQLVLSKGPAI